MNEDDIIHRAMEVRSVRKDAREADFVASSETIDRHGTILRANWDLENFNRNPTVLWCHNKTILPIGRARNTRVESKFLLTTVQFAGRDAGGEFAETVWNSVAQDFTRAMSVGFFPHTVREEKIEDVWTLVLDDNELIELSVTPIGSNPDALAKARARAIGRVPEIGKASAARQPSERNEEDMDKDAEIASLKAKVSTVEAERDALKTENARIVSDRQASEAKASTERTALEKQNEKLVQERDAAIARAEAAEGSIVERDVKACVDDGRIPENEREEMTDLARTNRSLFDRIMKQRTPKTDAAKKDDSKLGAAPVTERQHSSSSDDGADLVRTIRKDMNDQASRKSVLD